MIYHRCLTKKLIIKHVFFPVKKKKRCLIINFFNFLINVIYSLKYTSRYKETKS